MNAEKRQEIERKIVRCMIRTMKASGWNIARINDGGEPDEDALNPNETEAMDTIFSVSESSVLFKKPDGRGGNLHRSASIILGNDGYDCIADNSVSQPYEPNDDFEAVMSEVDDYAESLIE